jgi:hypothetical protein
MSYISRKRSGFKPLPTTGLSFICLGRTAQAALAFQGMMVQNSRCP